MPPNVKILGRAFSDPRFRLMGKLMGSDEFSALGRMAYLWQFCTERQTYILPEKLVESVVDVDAMVLADLGERVEGGIRVRGVEGKIEWFGRLQESGRNSALKRWAAHNSDRSPMGNPEPTNGSPVGGPKEEEVEISSDSESERESPEREIAEGSGARKRPKPDQATAEERPVVEAVLSKLSERAGVTYRPTTREHVKYILALLRDGNTERDLRLVIWHRWISWRDKPEMVQYLRPSTLFNRTKFAEYLPQAIAAAGEPEPRAGPAANAPVSEVAQQFIRGER